MDLATVEKLGRRIVDELGIAPACGSPGEANEPSADPDAFADTPEPTFERMIGRLLEQQTHRAKENPSSDGLGVDG